VLRWVDGDTVDMDVDWGNRIHSVERLRLYGIDTPERGQPGYAEATVFNVAKAPPGTAVRIRTTLDSRDKYGRLLAVIYLEDDPETLNDHLLAAGLAVPYFGGTK
jgi:micrococcal nuclease